MRSRGLLLLFICLSLTACVTLTATQSDATLKFAAAVSSLGEVASDELVKMHDQTVAMHIALYRLPDLPVEYSPVNPKTGKHEPIVVTEIDNGEYTHLAGRFSGNWYEVFSSGPRALEAYGHALTDIMHATNTTQVKQSSDSLAATLKAMPHSPLSKPAQDALSDLSQELTEWALAPLKAHAIRKIVTAYNGDVATVCGGIGQSFFIAAPGAHQPDNFAEDFQAAAQELETSAKTAMELHPGDRLIRSDALAGWLAAKQSLTETTTVFPNIIKSSAGCEAANAALVKALADRTPSMKDIVEFYDQTHQLPATPTPGSSH